MFISQQYRIGQIQQFVTLWYNCANLIENEPLVTSTNKKFSQAMVTYARILQNNPPVQCSYRLNFLFWKIEIIAKIINTIFFPLLLIIAMHRGSRVPD